MGLYREARAQRHELDSPAHDAVDTLAVLERLARGHGFLWKRQRFRQFADKGVAFLDPYGVDNIKLYDYFSHAEHGDDKPECKLHLPLLLGDSYSGRLFDDSMGRRGKPEHLQVHCQKDFVGIRVLRRGSGRHSPRSRGRWTTTAFLKRNS